MKTLLTIVAFALAPGLAFADEPDGLALPPGFHASVVAEGLGQIRHFTVRDNGDLYFSTPHNEKGPASGILAVRLDASHQVAQMEHFGTVDGGTGIRFHNGFLYASSGSGVYRFAFTGKGLVPEKDPELIVDGTPTNHPGHPRTNRPIAFDSKGNLYIALEGLYNSCPDPKSTNKDAPAGLKPCPDLANQGGVWRFSATKPGQKFPADGERLATGIRDMTALDWSPADGGVYGLMHGRDNMNKGWPNIFTAEDEAHLADEMHRIVKGTDFGWPYTYYDGVRKMRLISPDYGGDGKESPAPGLYSTPVLTFQNRRPAPVDIQFYTGKSFPASYRNGAFIVLHGTQPPRNGYNVVFVPFDKKGMAGAPTVFADGFAPVDPASAAPGRPRYRPIAAAVAPDGALFIADSQKGRIWRIAYGTN
jgi:glucose/arabinose dehydrogenase